MENVMRDPMTIEIDPWYVHPSHLIGGCPYCVHCGANLPGNRPGPFPISQPCIRSAVVEALGSYRPAKALTSEERETVIASAMAYLRKPGNADEPEAPYAAAYEATDAALHRREYGNRGEHETWSREDG